MAQIPGGNETVDNANNIQAPEAQREAHLLAALRPMAATLPESGIMTVINYGSDKAGVAPFWAGEGDAPTPAFIAEAAIEALRQGHTFYTYQRGIPQLRQAVAAYVRRHFLADVDPERIIITGSGMQAIMQTVPVILILTCRGFVVVNCLCYGKVVISIGHGR